MTLFFWIKRFVTVFAGVFLVLFAVGLLRSRPLAQVATESAVWAGIGSTIFLVTRIYRSRRGEHCALCKDTPEMLAGGANPLPKDGQARND